MAVHIYGLPVDMDPLRDLAAAHDLRVIEDAAEVLGQTYGGRPCGSFGDVSVFSFYPNKQVTTGEGGMVLTDDPVIAARARSYRNLCFEPQRRFVHRRLGWNYRMTNLQAAVGLAQMDGLDAAVQKRRAIGRRYAGNLADLAGLQLPLPAIEKAENLYWVFGVVLDDALRLDAAAAMEALKGRGIGTRPFFWPMHEQPVFREMGLFAGETLPVCERLARRGFYLPSGLALTGDEIDTVCEAVRELLG
jgi:perosamine synthetase